MPKTDHIDPEDRNITLHDLKQRAIVLRDNNQALPEEDIYDEPVRYYKLNKVWAKIIFGLLNHLENESGWPDAQGPDHSGIQQVMKYEQGIDLALEIDCEQIEDCIETSVTIINMQTIIDNQTIIINNLTAEIERVDNEQATDGVVHPDNPAMSDAANDLCKSAAYVAVRLTAALLDAWDAASTVTLQEFMATIFGEDWWNFDRVRGFYQYAVTISDPTLGPSAATYEDEIRNHLFCAELDREVALGLIDTDTTIPTDERVLWMAILENYRQSQIDEWAAIGTLSEDTPDCTEGCPWIIVFDFKGDYTPDGNETAIYTGDYADVLENCVYEAGLGYHRTTTGGMSVRINMPEQCRLLKIRMEARDSVNSLRHHGAVVDRGTSGTGAEVYGPDFSYTSPGFLLHEFDIRPVGVIGAVLTRAHGRLIPETVASNQMDAAISKLILIGQGAYPQR